MCFCFLFRTNKYLQKSAITRVCAVGGFFISIPVFLTGKFPSKSLKLVLVDYFSQFLQIPLLFSTFVKLGNFIPLLNLYKMFISTRIIRSISVDPLSRYIMDLVRFFSVDPFLDNVNLLSIFLV